jgi:hypothetical protein
MTSPLQFRRGSGRSPRLGLAQLASVSLLLAACGGSVDGGGTGGAGAQAGSGGSGAQAGSGGAMGGSGGAMGGSGGVTGGSGGVTGGSGGLGGVAGFGGGTGGGSCGALEQAYSDVLTQAKVCNPFIDMNECTAQVADQLACPCGPTFVNGGNGETIKMLQEIQDQWSAQKCYEGIGCPAIACQPPAGGGCEVDASGKSGSCQDYWLNGA